MSGLPTRFGAALAAGVAVAGLAVGGVTARSLRQREEAWHALLLAQRARAAAVVVAPALAAGEGDWARRLAEASRAAGAPVAVYAPDGARLGAPSGPNPEPAPPEVVAALAGREGRASRPDAASGRPQLFVATPAHGHAIRVSEDLAALEARVALHWRRAGVASALAALAAFAGGYAWARRLRDALVALRDRARAIRQGGSRPAAPEPPRGELGELARAIEEIDEVLRARLRSASDERERLRAVLSGMAEGVLVLDRDGRVLLANQPFREFFDVWGDAEGRSALALLRRADVDEALALAATSREPVVREIALPGPEPRVLEMHAGRFPSTGERLGAVAVFHDVTELRRLERVRSEFVANVSHELKTPLTSIRGFTEVLQQGELPAEQREQILAIVARNAERLGALIDDLLELSRIEGRSEPVVREPVDAVAVARTLLRDLKPRVDARRLEVRLDATTAVRALGDRRALERVLLNLLDNAIKYTEPGGHVAVRVAAEEGRAVVSVADDGIGIPASDLGRVFERFYRVDKARSRDLGGTGLGLAIVKHLVQAMDGEIFVESEEGEGTRFRVVLPLAP